MNISDYYVEQGEGDPIVFLHGSFANTSTWKPMVEIFSKTHHCVCIKQPGHGGAPPPEDFDDPSVETEVAIVEQVLQHLNIGPAQAIHLVAHSFGGVVAMAVALSGRVSLRALTLFEPVTVGVLATAGKTEDAAAVDSFCADYRQAIAEGEKYACARVIDFWGGAGQFEQMPEFIKESMEPLTHYNARHWDLCESGDYPQQQYQRCRVPTLIVCGDRSSPILRAIAAALAQYLPNATTASVSGASHFLVTSHARECLHWIEKQEAEIASQ